MPSLNLKGKRGKVKVEKEGPKRNRPGSVRPGS